MKKYDDALFTILQYFFILFYSSLGRTAEPHTDLTFQWRNSVWREKVSCFTIFLSLFLPKKELQQQQHSLCISIYAFQLPFLFVTINKFYLFVSLARHGTLWSRMENERKEILSHFKWLPIFYGNAVIRYFSSRSIRIYTSLCCVYLAKKIVVPPKIPRFH